MEKILKIYEKENHRDISLRNAVYGLDKSNHYFNVVSKSLWKTVNEQVDYNQQQK